MCTVHLGGGQFSKIANYDLVQKSSSCFKLQIEQDVLYPYNWLMRGQRGPSWWWGGEKSSKPIFMSRNNCDCLYCDAVIAWSEQKGIIRSGDCTHVSFRTGDLITSFSVLKHENWDAETGGICHAEIHACFPEKVELGQAGDQRRERDKQANR